MYFQNKVEIPEPCGMVITNPENLVVVYSNGAKSIIQKGERRYTVQSFLYFLMCGIYAFIGNLQQRIKLK